MPSIVGRSPSDVVRQLYDIQNGARAGMATQLMKATVVNLTLKTWCRSPRTWLRELRDRDGGKA